MLEWETADFSNFDYVRLSDNNFFILRGDRFAEGTLTGLPVYGPDPDGEREYDGVSMGKHPRDELPELDADFYEEEPAHFLAYRFPIDEVEELVKPLDDRADIIDRLTDEKQAFFHELEDLAAEADAELALIGSDTYGMATDSSDMDILVMGDVDGFQEMYEQLLEHDELERFPYDRRQEKVAKYADMYDIPEEASDHHVGNPARRMYWTAQEMKVNTIPSQVPGTWTDFYLPDADDPYEDVDGLTATVTDTAESLNMPRRYGIETEDGAEMDLLSYVWVFGGSFEEGDEIEVTGHHFPEENAVYMRETGHYAAPSQPTADE